MAEPNVLILDEPTNDLDIETLTSLEDVLDGWAGTLLVVSHDRYLLERVCDRQVALLGDGAIRDLPGGVEQYLDLRAAAKRSVVAARGGRSGATGAAAASGDAAPRQAPAHSAAEIREARKEMAGSSGSCPSWPAPRSGSTRTWPRRRPTTRRCWSSTASCATIVDERETLEMEWLTAAEIVG